ncbi:MAG: ATP cone domain-containing protein [Nitrososphaeria archaeon]|jgi:ribonucleoside-triphosphate reductase
MSDDLVNFESVYSALGSNERLTILRDLNKSGSLSYTELKNNCGFVKKRESGRFAYHLRLLSAVNLISLNKNTRKYSLTPFGRVVLTVTNELKDAALQSSGKIYVRTSRHKIEEFDSDKIYQSLIREANIPRDLASKITAEAESRISKLENVHLTAPLIRELVNSILVEKGLDEYRNKLTRLGLPVKDVAERIYQIGLSEGDVLSLRLAAADAVFTDYLLLTQIGSEALDMHLSGDISIVNSGCWGIMPDSVFFDALCLISSDVKFGVKNPAMSRVSNEKDNEPALMKIKLIIKKMLEETSDEIVIENFVEFISQISGNQDRQMIKEKVYELISNSISNINPISKNILSFQINLNAETDRKALEGIIDAYMLYLRGTLRSRVKLVLNVYDRTLFKEELGSFITILNNGGNIMIASQPTRPISYLGIRKNFDDNDILPAGTIVLHSLALNLPRFFFSGTEESYLKSLLKIRLQKTYNIMETRKNILIDLMEKKLLYIYEYNNDLFPKNSIEIVLNMVGLEELVRYLIPQDVEEQNKMWIKLIDFSQKILEGEKTKSRVFTSVYVDSSAERFYELDRELFPETAQSKTLSITGKYSQIPVLGIKALEDENFLKRIQARIDKTKGGYHAILDVSTLTDELDIGDAIENMLSRIGVFKVRKNLISCGTCGAKSTSVSRCPKCGSASILNIQTDN